MPVSVDRSVLDAELSILLVFQPTHDYHHQAILRPLSPGYPVQNLLYVGLGGATGSILRYLLSVWANRAFPTAILPVGTFAANVVGCLVLGLLSGLADSRDLIREEVRLLLMVGLLGGFTTFSTFGVETLSLARGSERWVGLVYAAGSVVVGVGAAWVGHWVGRSV